MIRKPTAIHLKKLRSTRGRIYNVITLWTLIQATSCYMFWQKRFIPALLIVGWLSGCGSDQTNEFDSSNTSPVSNNNTTGSDSGIDVINDSDQPGNTTSDDENNSLADGTGQPANTIHRVSLGANGVELNDDTGLDGASLARVSSNGRFVAFTTAASNAVGDDENQFNDVYYRNRSTGAIRRISIGANGETTNNHSVLNDMTPDGRYLVFSSNSTNIVPAGTGGASQIYRHDTLTGETLLVSQNSAGQSGNGTSVAAQISADGTTIVYRSFANNIIEGDTNEVADVVIFNAQTLQSTSMTANNYLDFEDRSVRHDFTADGNAILLSVGDSFSDGKGITVLHNTATGELENIEHDFGANSAFVDKFISDNSQYIVYADRISKQIFRLNLSNNANQLVSVNATTGINFNPDISADGRHISYQNITTGNIYLRDMSSELTVEVTFGLNGAAPNGGSGSAKIVGNTEFIAFRSSASNLVENDKNFKQDIFLYRTDL